MIKQFVLVNGKWIQGEIFVQQGLFENQWFLKKEGRKKPQKIKRKIGVKMNIVCPMCMSDETSLWCSVFLESPPKEEAVESIKIWHCGKCGNSWEEKKYE